MLVGIDGQLATHDAVITNPDNATFRVVNFNDVERNLLGVFGEWNGALGADWNGEFGLRVNQVRMDAGPVEPQHGWYGDAHGTAIATCRTLSTVRTAARPIPMSTGWRASCARCQLPLTVEIGFARKTRSPSYQERYLWAAAGSDRWPGRRQNYIGDINLDPEVSHQVELALNMESADAYFEPRIFYRDVSDYIQGVRSPAYGSRYCSSPTWMPRSTAPMRPGVTGSMRRWSLGGIVSYVRGKRDDVSDNLYRIAPLNGTLGLTYTATAWDVTAEGVFYDRQDKVSAYQR